MPDLLSSPLPKLPKCVCSQQLGLSLCASSSRTLAGLRCGKTKCVAPRLSNMAAFVPGVEGNWLG